jgi:hypothetical protein
VSGTDTSGKMTATQWCLNDISNDHLLKHFSPYSTGVIDTPCTDKKENQIFLIYKEIRSGAFAKSCMNNGLLILYMGKYFRISSYIRKLFLIYEFATAPL